MDILILGTSYGCRKVLDLSLNERLAREEKIQKSHGLEVTVGLKLFSTILLNTVEEKF